MLATGTVWTPGYFGVIGQLAKDGITPNIGRRSSKKHQGPGQGSNPNQD